MKTRNVILRPSSCSRTLAFGIGCGKEDESITARLFPGRGAGGRRQLLRRFMLRPGRRTQTLNTAFSKAIATLQSWQAGSAGG